MGIKEIDHTIYSYTVGREDCKVLPRSFKTLAEAKAYLAEQDKGALERGDFYLNGQQQQDKAWSSRARAMSDDDDQGEARFLADLRKLREAKAMGYASDQWDMVERAQLL